MLMLISNFKRFCACYPQPWSVHTRSYKTYTLQRWVEYASYIAYIVYFG